MINKTRCLFYEVGGEFFKSLEEAQKVDLVALIPADLFAAYLKNPVVVDCRSTIADWLLANSTAIVDCLTTTPRSRLRGRKIHGAERKPRSDIGKKRMPKAETPSAT